jgi:hypothetical protein
MMKRILRVGAITMAAIATFAVAPLTVRADHNDSRSTSFYIGIAAEGFRASFASYDRCAPPPPRWIPGHYETRRDRVCIPGYWQTIEVPAEYGWVRHGWRWCYVVVKPACTRRVWVPERYEWRETRVWVPGHYETPDRYARAY